MNNVIYGFPNSGNESTKGGEPPMSGLEQRVIHLETQVTLINNKIDNITENYATKADLSNAKVEIIKWNLIVSIGLIGAVFTVLRYIPQIAP